MREGHDEMLCTNYPKTRAWQGVVAVAGLLALLSLFFLPALTTPDQFLARDSGSLHYPTKHWIAERWSRGELPAWNPFGGLGVPEISGAVNAVLHPFNSLLVFLPFEAGFKAWVLLSYVAAASGVLAWARLLGCGWPSAFVGAVAFALSGHMVGSSDNLQYLTTLAFVPWILAAAQAFLCRPGPVRLALVALSSAVCAAGGDPQGWGCAILLIPLLLPLMGSDSSVPYRRRLLGAVAAAGAAAAGAAPLWLPIALWLPHSSRGAGAMDYARLTHWDLLPGRLLELVIPNLLRVQPGTTTSWALDALSGGMTSSLPWVASIYFGVTTLLLAAGAACFERRARLLLAVAAVATWISCGVHLGFANVAHKVPVLGSLRYWEKMFVWPTLLVCVAAALGLQTLLGRDLKTRRRFSVAAIAVGVVLLSLQAAAGQWPAVPLGILLPRPPLSPAGAEEFLRNLHDGLVFAGLAALLLGIAAWASTTSRLGRFAPALFLAAAVIDPFAANRDAYVLAPARLGTVPIPLAAPLLEHNRRPRIFTPFEIPRDRWPDLSDLESHFIWGARSLSGAWNVQRRIANLDPYVGMPPRRLSLLRESTTPLTDVTRAAGVWSIEAIVVPVAPEWARIVGLDPPYTVLGSDPELPAFLVALPHRPRAYLAQDVRATSGGRAEAETLSLSPASRSCVIEGAVPPDFAPAAGRVEMSADEPEHVALDVMVDRPALVVLNDQDAPGWKALVDGRETDIVATNLLARGVWVPAGRHRIEFRYRTPGLLPGIGIALGLLGILSCWALLARRATAAS